jgi:quercetin dioxygenase-like cupin family protein
MWIYNDQRVAICSVDGLTAPLEQKERDMLTRRNFTCAICAALGFAAISAGAEAQTAPTVARRTLQQTGYLDHHVCIQQLLDILPDTPIARHIHAGVESGYLLSGNLSLSIDGERDRILKAGDSYQIPFGTPHSGHVGTEKTRIVVNFVVEKDKPLVLPPPT